MRHNSAWPRAISANFVQRYQVAQRKDPALPGASGVASPLRAPRAAQGVMVNLAGHAATMS